MNLARFCFFTSLGAGIWVVVLTVFGYWVGRQQAVWQEAWNEHRQMIMLVVLASLAVLIAGYVWHYRRNNAAGF
jgi:membrane protein DedA with SNARE-associated domain